MKEKLSKLKNLSELKEKLSDFRTKHEKAKEAKLLKDQKAKDFSTEKKEKLVN